ncbi:MAG: flavodoxin-dependent (E)-4-hydroxy-3-methylbut-2-enyl-diphosphate synthase [bacterium]|nr:flavodoxin-dependent (E)-4-hydroxy-3-methylbut-2-enyl-diphosphate synthase [bacterium]
MADGRNKTKVVNIGGVKIGGNYPIIVQSMAKTITTDVASTVAQIKRLEKINCEIIRVGVPDMAAALCLSKIKKQIRIPLVADIHFQWQLAVEAINQGVDKIRINPGNISKDKLTIVLDRAKARKIAIRIGVNSGSLKSLRQNSRTDKATLMVKALAEYIQFFENAGFKDIVTSLKATQYIQRGLLAQGEDIVAAYLGDLHRVAQGADALRYAHYPVRTANVGFTASAGADFAAMPDLEWALAGSVARYAAEAHAWVGQPGGIDGARGG